MTIDCEPAARLLAAIEQTERIAQETADLAGSSWRSDPCDSGQCEGHIASEQEGELIACQPHEGGGMYDPIGPHIAHNDPEAALRQCSADRKLLAIHIPQENGQGELVCDCCARDTLDGDREGEWPCETLLTRFEAYGLEVTQ